MADPSTAPPLTRASVQAAHALIRPYIHETPVFTSTTLNRLASTPQPSSPTPNITTPDGTTQDGITPASPTLRLWFKAENLQRIGAFKARGAFHAVSRLLQTPPEHWSPSSGVATHSSGNHAAALALAASTYSLPSHIVMPRISAPPKIAATRGYGASITFSGSTSTEREAVTASVIAQTGAALVPPYDHPDVILGQGTAALELQSQFTSLTTNKTRKLDGIIAPCGGGGLLSGTALACEGTGTAVFGAEPEFEGADDARRAYYSADGERIRAVKTLTIADGLRTPVGAIPWSIIYERRLVSGIYAVTEDQIKAALRLVYERMKLVVEPSAVVGLAVALFNEDFRAMVEREAGDEGWDLGVIFTGGNVSLEALGKLFAEGEGQENKETGESQKQ